ncbi:MAG: XdhC/CoxI family protein [Bacillota bacterium]|nr:XdhC/CoxI family protein [Bacillota bacterium]
MNIVKILNDKIDDGEKIVLATVVEKTGDGPLATGGKLLLDENFNRYGTIAGGDLELLIIKKCKELFRTKKNELILFNLSSRKIVEKNVSAEMICGGDAKIFFEYFEPKDNLYIFGGSGNVGKEICKKIEGLDYKLHVIDRINPEFNFDYIFHNSNDSILGIEFCKNDYIIIATGSHRADYEILKKLVESNIEYKYLGMLASNKKIDELLGDLKNEINKLPKRIFSPIGLNIGGATPPEIAIAIISQIQTIKYSVRDIKSLGVIE